MCEEIKCVNVLNRVINCCLVFLCFFWFLSKFLIVVKRELFVVVFVLGESLNMFKIWSDFVRKYIRHIWRQLKYSAVSQAVQVFVPNYRHWKKTCPRDWRYSKLMFTTNSWHQISKDFYRILMVHFLGRPVIIDF